jgi:hypothetical protein
MQVFLIGPQTRLAAALLQSSSWEKDTTFVLVARSAREYDRLRLAHPGLAVHPAWQPDAPRLQPARPVAVLCCAFGMIHVELPNAAVDLQRVSSDYRVLDSIVQQCADQPLHLVFISSVLALCPRSGREYYAGWKNVAEGLVRHTASGPRATVSVFYPGRLVDLKTVRRPQSFLHTSYRELAERLVKHVRRNQPREAVVGWDSRLWLVRRSLGLIWSALTPRH